MALSSGRGSHTGTPRPLPTASFLGPRVCRVGGAGAPPAGQGCARCCLLLTPGLISLPFSLACSGDRPTLASQLRDLLGPEAWDPGWKAQAGLQEAQPRKWFLTARGESWGYFYYYYY